RLCFQPEHDYTHFPAFVKCFFGRPCWKMGQRRGFQPVLEAGSRRLRPFRPPDPCRNLVLLPKNGRRQGGKTLHSAKFWEPGPLRPPGSLGPPAAGPPCRQGSPEEPLRATTGKVRGAAKNFSQGRSFPFLSTLPARGATVEQGRNPALPSFLSTLPARGATVKSNKHQRWILRKSPK